MVPYLLGDQEDTRFYLFILIICTVFGMYNLRRGLGKCHAEVERRMKGG